MRTVVIDDDSSSSDSEWSIEIFDGIYAPPKTTKPVKQTPPTRTTTTTSDSKPASKEIHPFFLKDFSTKAGVSERNGTNRGGQGTKQERSNHTLPALKPSGIATFTPSEGPDIPKGLTTASRQTSVFAAQIPKPSTRGKPFISREKAVYDLLPPAHPPNSLQKRDKARDVDANAPPGIKRDASSGSSIPSSSASVNKDEHASLPIYSFMDYKSAPAVVYTQNEIEANELVQTLRGPLGFDLEWRVMWQSGAQERRTALVQVCDRDTILLMQVSSMKRFPKKVLDVIESPNIVKTGANILNDGEKLYRDFGIRAKGLVELGAFATRADDKFSSVYNREIVSLAKMVAMYLGKTLTKGKVRTSNWEAHLTPKMVEYAANDCHCALMVYHRLEEIAAQDGKTLDMTSYSCQVNPRTLKLKDVTPSLPQTHDAKPPAQPIPDYCIPEPPRPQWLRAYKLWHVDKMPLQEMCTKLRTAGRIEPLKESTVISYVVSALQADARLPFDMRRLKELVLMEAGSWQRHRQWIASRE